MTDVWDYYMDLANAGINPDEVEWEEPSPAVLENLKQGLIASFAELEASIQRDNEKFSPPQA